MSFKAPPSSGDSNSAALALRGESASWRTQRKSGVKQYNACVQSYNVDPGLGPQQKMQLFDQARVEYWSKYVCLVFANHLAVSAVKISKRTKTLTLPTWLYIL